MSNNLINGNTCFDQINQFAKNSMNSILSEWLPGGKHQGNEYIALNPKRNDKTLGSFSINTTTGKWSDFAANVAGGDIISLVAYLDGCNQYVAGLKIQLFLKIPINFSNQKTKSLVATTDENDFELIVPIPEEIPKPEPKHYKLGKPSKIWAYHNAEGNILCFVCRFETSKGKEFRPYTLWQDKLKGEFIWRWKALPPPLPLYNLHLLSQNPQATAVITEGEKASDAAASKLFPFPEYVTTTNLQGAKSISNTDLSPLAGRRVILWADNDKTGNIWINKITDQLQNIGVKSLHSIPLNLFETSERPLPEKWDAANAVEEGWTEVQVKEKILENLTLIPLNNKVETAENENSEIKNNRMLALEMCMELEFFHCPNKIAYATVPIGKHKENYAIRSRAFEMWFSKTFYQRNGRVLNSCNLNEVLSILEAKALFDHPQREIYLRVAFIDNKIYIDLCNQEYQYVEIDSQAWKICDDVPIKFIRKNGMSSLPIPEEGGNLNLLSRHINIHDGQLPLLIGWILGALCGLAPYPVLIIIGGQGSGKSMGTKLIRYLIDPSIVPLRGSQNDERDLIVSANSSHIIVIDNSSKISAALSDRLCRASSGGGFSTRKLYSDGDEALFKVQNPIIINGIDSVPSRPDLLERCLVIELKHIEKSERRTESKILKEFFEDYPKLFGAICTSLSGALKNLPATHLQSSPRMADFARFVSAAEPSLGWEAGTFLKVFDDNQKLMAEDCIESCPFIVSLVEFLDARYNNEWHGTMSELLHEIKSNLQGGYTYLEDRYWPRSVNAAGQLIKRFDTYLRQLNYEIVRVREYNNKKRERMIYISKV